MDPPARRLAIDLHRHLEGAMRPATFLELAERQGRTARLDEISSDTAADDLLAYLARLEAAVATWATLDDVHRVASEAVEDGHAEGLDHLELRFSPRFVGLLAGLDATDVAEAVVDGVRAGTRETGLSVSLIGILSRTFGPDATAEELDAILTHRAALQGIDLAGDEHGWPASLFAGQIRTARDAGLRVTIHAGEAAGPHSVRETLDELRPERIGHGVRAVEDPRLCERLARDGVVLEVALTSNVHTSTSPDYARHQVRRLLDAGVEVTLNTDNPTASRTSLAAELDHAAVAAGLTTAEVDAATTSAGRAAFLDDHDRAALLARGRA